MSMTRQDFQAIADAVAEASRTLDYGDPYRDEQEAQAVHQALAIVTRELATACHRQYKGGAGFDRSRFVTACGFPEA